MEIVHLILGKANPNRMNGVNKVVNSLASFQTHLGHNVAVWGITPNPDGDYPERNYQTRLFPSLSNKFKVSGQLFKAILQVKEGTVFHLHGGFIPEFYHLCKALIYRKIPYVFTPHGAYNHIAMQKNKWVKKIYFTFFEKSVVRHAKALHCLGNSEVEAVKKWDKNVSKILIPNGQNRDELIIKQVPAKSHPYPIFGFCGRIDIHTKGLDILFHAFADYLFHRDGKAELWIIGDGEELDYLKKLARELNIERQVTFLGKKFGDEKNQLIASMDAFFHPSRNEGIPGAVLEACAMGVPSVVSEESNMASYIRKHKAGIGLPENNSTQLAIAMQNMFIYHHNQEIQKLKRNAQKMVREDFDWRNIAQQLIDIYQA